MQPTTCKCGKCGEVKPLAHFPRRGKDITSKTRTSSCKKCRAAYMVAWKNASPERRDYDRRKAKEWQAKYPRYVQQTKLRLAYGMTIAQYDALVLEQGGVCAICRCEDRDIVKKSGKRRSLAVDHCHETGTVRGLLCGDCNRALGLVKESPVTLVKMISYLTRGPQSLRLVG